MSSHDEGIVQRTGLCFHLVQNINEAFGGGIRSALVFLQGNTIHTLGCGIILQIIEGALVVFLAQKHQYARIVESLSVDDAIADAVDVILQIAQ